MSLTSCIKELGAALDARDKKAIIDATLRLRRTVKDPDAAAIQAATAHQAQLQQQLGNSEEIDRAHPASEGEAFEVVGMQRVPGKERWIVRGRMDKPPFKDMEHAVHAEFKGGEYRVWQMGSPGGATEIDSRTFKDLGKAEAYARQLAGKMKPALTTGAAPKQEDSQYDRAREQTTELALEFGIPRRRIVGAQESEFGDYRLEEADNNGVAIDLTNLTDHVTQAPTFELRRSGRGVPYESHSLPTQEAARALLQRWFDEAAGKTVSPLDADRARLLEQFPIGTHVKIASWNRVGNDNGKFAGRTGEIVKGHFDGWYVKLDPTIRERSVKQILVMAKDGLEKVDKASIKPARTKAEIEAERRETERTLFAELVKDKLASPMSAIDHLITEIRRRAGDVELGDEKVRKLAEAIRKKAAEGIQEAAKAEHRNPAVLQAAMAAHVASTYPDASAVTPEQHSAFMAGFQHAMAGKTKSTLTGDNLADRHKGYAAAQLWKDTEEGAAWFEGRAVNKLQNTGLDLRRHWEQLREQMKASETDVQKAWRQIERATTRADLFAPLLERPGATPGFKAWVTDLRDGTRPFKEWLQERKARWYGSSSWRGQKSDITNVDRMLDGSRYPQFVTGPNIDPSDRSGEAALREKWKNDQAFRAEWLRQAANEYLDAVRDVLAMFDGMASVKPAAEALQARMMDPKKLAEYERQQGKHWRPSAYDMSQEGSSLKHSLWRGKDYQLLDLMAVSHATKELIAKEDSVELPDKAKALTPPRLDRVERAGLPDRRKGENVTPQQFKDTFGFADVGFGKWVGAQQDQDHLNYSFDAFADLAQLWGTDPKSMGLGGALHFTIGALGHGKFAAHFQRAHPSPEGGTVQVINVTNTRGDGTVGHEWTHALDANLGGEWKRVRNTMLDILRHGQITVQQVEEEAKKFLIGGWFWNGNKKLSKVHAAVRAMDWIRPSRMGQTAYNQNAIKLGKDYWGNDEEMLARASEAWLSDTLGDKANTYLVNPRWVGDGAVTKEKGYRGTPYPSGHERKTFNKLFDALAKSIKWKDGRPTVAHDDFRTALGEEFFEWKKRAESLNSIEAMTKFHQDLLEQGRLRVQQDAAQIEEKAAAKARELEAAAAEEEESQEPAVVDAPGPADSSGPLSDNDLEDLFDQAAAELREERAEQPDLEPPPDAESEPEREPQPETRQDAKAQAAAERERARELIERVKEGHYLVFSGTEWASRNRLPRIQDFPSDKTRHMGFGVFEVTTAEFSGTFAAGAAMSRGGPEGTSYDFFSLSKGEWSSYPRAAVLNALQDFVNEKDRTAPKTAPAPAADKSASQLLAEAAKLGVKGADEALKGLAKLFGGGPGRLNSFPAGFDEETYQKAKPHFQAALAAFQAAGRTLKDLFKLLIAQYGDGIKEYAIRFAKDQELTANLGTAAPAAEQSPSMRMARTIAQRLSTDSGMDWRMLFELADNTFGGTQAQGKYTPKDAYDALELGVNLHLQRGNGEAFTPAVDQTGAAARLAVLERLMPLLPTQSKRTGEQQDMQQFSTVPPLAYAAAWAANITGADTVMEPSAGVGGLAVFAKNAGARLVLNELSSRRAALLGELFPTAKVWTENAEQLNNILPDEIRPSVVLMNPPFSNSAATNIKKDTQIGARHVEQALARLAPGGRLVAIVGDGMKRGSPAFRDWWAGIDKKYHVRAAIPIDGSGYAKYGTTFDNVLLVIDKTTPPAWPGPLTTPVKKYSELIPLLQEIRDARADTHSPGNDRDSVERDAAERAREDAVRAGAGDAGAGAGAGGPAVVGRGESPGAGGRAGAGGDRRGAGAGRRAADVRGPGDAGVAGDDDAGAGRADAGAAAPAVTATEDQKHTEAITASVFEPYRPQRLQVEGAKEHPGKLVQSAAMATVAPPPATYTPNLPAKTITKGLLSIAQIESVVYAGQAHQEILSTGERKGYFIGDGTGVGKGREISGILLDNLRQGRKKHVWVTEKQGLIADARRDFEGVGGDPAVIFNQNETTAEGKIDSKGGILFTTYATLRSGAQSQALNPKPLADKALLKDFPPGSRVEVRLTEGGEVKEYSLHADGFNLKEGKVYIEINGHRRFVSQKFVTAIDGVAAWPLGKPKKKAGQSRMDQLVSWLGKDFDGVIVFDEAHNAGNAVAMKGERGFTDPSLQALSVVELQKQLPKARVVYVSATGATDVSNLSFATRLGLWGPSTPFADVNAFIDQMTAGGLATMELVARDMKQLGLYLARSLSYEGVTYSRVEHELTPAQRAMYDRMAEAWQMVLRHFNEAMEKTGADKSPQRKSAVRSAFWSGHQRFFNQIITSMQMPSVLADAEREIAAGNALVMQLVNTNEAAQERALAKRKDDDDAGDLEELDLTPLEQLRQMVEKAFPVQQFEEYKDEQGKKQVRPVVDSTGKPVENKEAVAQREALLKDLETIADAVPAGPLEQLIDYFGPGVVAEVTGRGRRVVAGRWNTKDKGKAFVESRGGAAVRADAASFMADKKQILVFSDAGGTGFSFHADLTAKNQRKRIHYLLQPGWRANKAVQGFGRSHRTNQASEPHYKLASTNIPAQKRFLSSIARRLDQLGALTKGQRDTANQGLFSEKDNLEGKYAQQAVRQFLDDVRAGRGAGGIEFMDLLQQMGLENILDPETGQISESKYPETRLFLNRMLSLKLDLQDKVFEHFIRVMEEKVEIAVQRGEFDAGLQTIQALSAHVLRDEVVYTEPKSGAETRYVELELTQPTYFYQFPTSSGTRRVRYYQNERSGRVWALTSVWKHTEKDGTIKENAQLAGTHGYQSKPLAELEASSWKKIDAEQARALWEAENAKRPKTYTERAHMIVGAMLPIWDRLQGEGYSRIRVARTQTDDGRRYLGRVIEEEDLKTVLKRLNVDSAASRMKPAQILAEVLKGSVGELANGWKLMRSVVSGDPRVELETGYLAGAAVKELVDLGVIREMIQFRDRFFIPTGRDGAGVLQKVVANRPLIDLASPKPTGEAVFARRGGSIAKQLRERGEEVLSQMDAMRRFSAGERLFGFHEMDEDSGPPTEITSVEDLGKWAYDQLVALPAEDDGVAFARRRDAGGGFGLQRRSMIQMAVDQMTASWKRKPKIHVLASMADAPEEALREMRAQAGQNAAGETAGFLLDGEIYLVADQLRDRDEIREVLYHEALGHYGLRGVFGDGLVPILQQLATMRPQLLAKKAKEYGLDLSKEEDRLLAAEEVLAEMAQTKPELGWVQRTIALIRRALRAIGMVRGLSDNDIIANFILPARGFVERGRAAAAGGAVAFSRSGAGSWSVWAHMLPRAPSSVDGRTVRKEVPNMGSIEASLTDFDVLPGVRVVPMDVLQPDAPTARVRALAAEIEASGELNPLIVVVDREGPYILEGAHRFDALGVLGAKEFPAIVVIDKDGRDGGDKPKFARRAVFARTTTIGKTRQHTPEQERAMRNVGFMVQEPTLRERAEALWKGAGKKLAQGIADQFRPVKELSAEAYALLRLSKGASGAFETLLHGGRLKLTDGVYDFDAANRGGVVKKLLVPLQGEHHDFFRWIAANRAERLAKEERERLFSAEDIAALKTLADGQLQFDFKLQHGPKAGQVTRSRAEAYADSLVTFNEFNRNVMDMAEASGLIDPEARKLWEHEFYVPFYRVSEDFDGGFRGANIKTGVVRQKAFERLKGGKEKLNADLLDNTLLNWAHLLDAAAKNRAAKATLEAAQAAGIALEAKEEVARQIGRATGNRQGVVWFMDQGVQRYFVVDDPYVLEAITSLEYAGMRNPVMDAMGTFKHWLTVGVTASPFFKIRNLIRDSVTVLGTSTIDPNALRNVARGWKDTDPKSDRYFQLLAGGGTIHFGTMLEGTEAKRVQALVESGIDAATILDSQDKVKAFYRHYIEPAITAYNELGNRGEAVNRAALYDQLRKQGKSHAEASLQARDLMDFSMQGTFTSIRFLTQVVPFFNARIQGMYKLGRAAKEDPARFGMVVGATSLVSLALLAAYGDDDDWRRREEWDRDNFWWFKFGGIAFRIPKPFEIGAMATLAERGAELMFDDEMTGSRFRKAVLDLAGNQLSMNPIPQLIKPWVDVYANFDSFTDRPIETMDMERLAPEFRFTERTSMLARGASTALNAAAGAVGGQSLSPVQIDHLLRGYFGWLGAFIVGAGDTVFRPATNQPRQAAPDYWKSLTGGMVAELEGAPSRYVSQMYDQAREIEQAYGTWRMLMRQGKGEEAAEFRAENQEALAKYRGIERIKRQEGELNQRIREIERSDMDPVAKRERIQQIRDQQDRLARVLSPGAR